MKRREIAQKHEMKLVSQLYKYLKKYVREKKTENSEEEMKKVVIYSIMKKMTNMKMKIRTKENRNIVA